MNLEVFKDQGYVPALLYVERVEYGQAVGSAEDQRSVGQARGGAVGELVATDAVGREVVDELPDRAVVASQTVHRGDPDVALAVFLNGADVEAGGAGDGEGAAALVLVLDQAVGHGAEPGVAGAVAVQIDRR